MRLENEALIVELKSAGAELTRIYSKKTGLEYLWKGDAMFWGRHAPVLFPIVGQVKDKSYQVDGENYHLSQHGFARDNEFEVVYQDDSKARFELKSSVETLEIYPFEFVLHIEYDLVGSELSIAYSVINKSNKEMFFSIGAHPAFNCPLVEGTTFDDYYLEFPQNESPVQIHLNTQTGLRNGVEEKVLLGTKLPLSYELFKNDAVIYEGLKSQEVTLKSDKHNHGLTFKYPEWRYLAFWTKGKDVPFVCLEPWRGITDADDSNGDYVNKVGVEKLAASKHFDIKHSVEIF